MDCEAAVAAPAALILWLMANVTVGAMSLLAHCSQFLDPFVRLLGLDGPILIAFILGFPAHEIVISIVIMAYMAKGSLTDMSNLTELHTLLVELCGNSLLESMYAKIYSLMQQFRIYSLTSVQRFDESLVEHRDLIHCLLSNNTAEAQRINQQHLRLAREKIIQHFSEQSRPEDPADGLPASR